MTVTPDVMRVLIVCAEEFSPADQVMDLGEFASYVRARYGVVWCVRYQVTYDDCSRALEIGGRQVVKDRVLHGVIGSL